MKIGILTRPLDQGTSGSGHHLLEILNSLLDLNTEFEITLIHYQRNEKRIYRRAAELIIPRNPFRASRILRDRGFALLHYNPLTLLSPLWGINAKKVATEHGAEPVLVPRTFPLHTVLHEVLAVPFLDRRMDHLVTVSETTKRFLVTRYRIPEERVTVCYNAVNEGFRVLGPGKLEAMDRYQTGERFFLHISKFSERKNPWTLLKGFSRFLESAAGAGEPYTLVLAGSGWDNPKVARFIRKHGLSSRVQAPGFIPQEDAVKLLNCARAFIFPSLAEGFGMPNVEAMACGCPLITSSAFAIPEIVGDAALIMADPRDDRDLAEKMLRLERDEELRQDLIRLGLERVRRFSWQESARRLLGVYRKLLL